jgi:long-chain acyl-CoA synthetase
MCAGGGTTGKPKGCELTHRNMLATTRMYSQRLRLSPGQASIYMFLPLAHVLARVATVVAIDAGGTLVYWSEDERKLMQEVAQCEPTHFVAVPRVYEKIHNQVLDAVERRGRIAALAFSWAQEVGRRAAPQSRRQAEHSLMFKLRLHYASFFDQLYAQADLGAGR